MSSATGFDPRTARWLLGLILAAGLVLRVAYALYDPVPDRFYDEHFALENVEDLLVRGSFKHTYYQSPVFNLPPAALVAASNALHELTGDERFLALDEEGGFHPAAYLVCRLLMAVYGTLAVALVFLAGRRLSSPAAGLVAAALMAFMPWQIHASGTFKPDALLVLAVVTALWASVLAAESGRWPHYLLAGVAIALAMSAKLSGGLAALPLVAATAAGWRERRRWLLLAFAGGASALAFVLLNPYWHTYGHSLRVLRNEYARTAAYLGMSPSETPARLLDWLLGGYAHGPVIGVAALAGLLLLGLVALRPATPAGERSRALMVVSFPPVFAVAYAAQTAYFKPNNLLPILPFTCLAAAWLLTTLWRWLGGRLRAISTSPARWIAAAALALALLPTAVLYVYRSLTPSTADLAIQLLRRRLGTAVMRTVVVEEIRRPGPRWARQRNFGRRIGVREVDRLSALAPEVLDLADAELFREERLRGPDAAFYEARVARVRPRALHTFRPRLLETGGPALVAVLHQYVLRSETRPRLEPCDRAALCLDVRMPADLERGERLSVALYLPTTAVPLDRPIPKLRLAGRELELFETGRDRGGRHVASERWIVADPSRSALGLEAEEGSAGDVQAVLYRWAERRARRR